MKYYKKKSNQKRLSQKKAKKKWEKKGKKFDEDHQINGQLGPTD